MTGNEKEPDPGVPGEEVPVEIRAGSYDDWTVAALRRRAKELGLSGYSGKKKPELIALLRGH